MPDPLGTPETAVPSAAKFSVLDDTFFYLDHGGRGQDASYDESGVEFITYLKYCKRLRYSEKPDYYYLKQIFRRLFKKHKFKYDYKYDWDIKDNKK